MRASDPTCNPMSSGVQSRQMPCEDRVDSTNRCCRKDHMTPFPGGKRVSVRPVCLKTQTVAINGNILVSAHSFRGCEEPNERGRRPVERFLLHGTRIRTFLGA